jgi:tetrathionate reductase subunit B
MAGVTLAPGVTLFDLAHGRAPSEPASSKVRWGMLVDLNRCASDCDACVTACDKENGLPAEKTATSAQWIRKVELKDMRGQVRSLPMMCQHCAEPPCVDVCPTGASFKRADGIVLVDRHTCIGCRYCMMACPYKARSFVHEPTTGQKPRSPARQGLRRVVHAMRPPDRP